MQIRSECRSPLLLHKVHDKMSCSNLRSGHSRTLPVQWRNRFLQWQLQMLLQVTESPESIHRFKVDLILSPTGNLLPRTTLKTTNIRTRIHANRILFRPSFFTIGFCFNFSKFFTLLTLFRISLFSISYLTCRIIVMKYLPKKG